MATKPTIIVVPGSWQPPVFFEGFAKKLNAAGYPTEVVDLPTVGRTETPLPGLAEDVAAIRVALDKVKSEGKKALVFGHSSGGLSGSNAIEGYDVVGFIYMSAFMIPKGKSVLEMLGGAPLPWMDIQGDRVFGVEEMLPQVAFHDLSPEDQKKWIKELTHTSAALFATPTNYEPWSNGVKCGYIFLSEDAALPPPVQQQMAAQLGPDAATVTLKASHCSHLSIPDQVVQAIVDLETRLK